MGVKSNHSLLVYLGDVVVLYGIKVQVFETGCLLDVQLCAHFRVGFDQHMQILNQIGIIGHEVERGD